MQYKEILLPSFHFPPKPSPLRCSRSPLLYPVPQQVFVKGETATYLWFCCHPLDLTACTWTWYDNDPSCYNSEEILSEKWKLEERWGRCTKQGREEVAWLYGIASLTGLVNLTNCYLQHWQIDSLKLYGAFLWGGKCSIFYPVICKYRSVSINIS